MTIDDILHPGESRRVELAQLDAQIRFLNHALSVLERPALSPQPNNGMGDARSETASADITASASRAADAFPCEWGCENGYNNKNIDGCDVMVRCIGCDQQPEGY